MKTAIITFAVISAIEFSSPLTQAQGTLEVSNLGQTPTGSMVIGSDSWIAQSFGTGTNAGGYELNSVQLLMDAASGSPGGFNVFIYNKSGSSPYASPGINIGSLDGSLNPSTGGIFTYTTSGITLLPSTLYFVVVTATTPIATGAYNWSDPGPTISENDGWIIANNYDLSPDGLSWQFSRLNTFQMAVYATPIPEPETGALLGLGLFCLGFLSRQRKRISIQPFP